MKLIKLLRDVIIAPHGVTDISHSIQTNNQLNLLKINTFMIGGTNFIINNYNYDDILNLLFFASTIIHFRHDMPEINKVNISKLTLSTLLVLYSPLIGLNLFSLYMGLIHVPRHYVKCNKFVKPYAKYLIMSILT